MVWMIHSGFYLNGKIKIKTFCLVFGLVYDSNIDHYCDSDGRSNWQYGVPIERGE